jgi:HSP20 family protein
MALIRTDPFREVDRLMSQMWGGANGARQLMMPLDAFRKDEAFLIRIDLPGVNADAVELTVEGDVLTVRAERPAPPVSEGIETLVSERPYGTFTRQVFLGDNLDTEKIEADYQSGVLTISIPVAEHAKPRRIAVSERRDVQEQLSEKGAD